LIQNNDDPATQNKGPVPFGAELIPAYTIILLHDNLGGFRAGHSILVSEAASHYNIPGNCAYWEEH
jgi:hypothetical protein